MASVTGKMKTRLWTGLCPGSDLVQDNRGPNIFASHVLDLRLKSEITCDNG